MQKAPSCVPVEAKMSDWCEILIHDDCSTDGTTDIVKEYAAKYPDLIFPLYEEENQYSKGMAGKIDLYNYKRAKGKYIAYCEGDDYWTEPLKLQMQIDFLEAHPDYSVCFHNTTIYNVQTEKFGDVFECSNCTGFDVSIDMFLNGKMRVGQPLSMVFRMDMYNIEWPEHYYEYCDTIEIFHLLRAGKGWFMNFIGGQYNLHPSGISASNPDLRRSWECCRDQKQMLEYTHDPCVEKCCLNNYLWRLDICLRENNLKEYFKTIRHALGNKFTIGIIVLRKGIIKLLKR